MRGDISIDIISLSSTVVSSVDITLVVVKKASCASVGENVIVLLSYPVVTMAYIDDGEVFICVVLWLFRYLLLVDYQYVCISVVG